MLSCCYKISIALIFFLFISFDLIGQGQQEIDSLKLLLQQPTDSKQQVDLYHLIAQKSSNINFKEFEQYIQKSIDLATDIQYLKGLNTAYFTAGKIYYFNGYYDSATKNIQQAQQLSIQLNDTTINARSFNVLGLIYMRTGKYDKSITCFEKSLKLRQQLGDKEGVGLVYGNIASIYKSKGNYEEALKYNFKALKIAQEMGKEKRIAIAYNSMGLIYKKQGKYAECLDMFLKGLGISENLNDVRGVVAGYINVGIVYDVQFKHSKALEYYFKALELQTEKRANDVQTLALIYTNIGITYKKEKLYEKALEFHFKALEIKQKIGNKPGLIYNYTNIGECFFYQKKTEEALEYLEEGFRLSKEVGLKSMSAILLYMLGELYYEQQNYSKAKPFLLEGMELAKKLGEPLTVVKSVRILTQIEKMQQNYQHAYDYHVLYKELSDSLLSVEKAKQLADINTKYETEKKEQQIKALEQAAKIKDLQLYQSTLYLIALLIVFTLMSIIGYLFYRQKQFKLQKKHHEVEQKLLRVQMNPHFIFNALTVIQKYMFDESSKKASYYLVKFSRLMRQVLENSRHEYIVLKEEVTMLDNYLSLQNLQQKQPFEYEIRVDDQIDVERIAIPPMFAQPFVENAIKHGIRHISEQGRILIHFKLDNQQIILIVEDNGIGMDKSSKIKSTMTPNHQSLATQITKERIMIFKQNYKKEVGFKVENLERGTRIIFHLPYQYL